MEPLQFQPLIKQARWGGRALSERLGKSLGQADNYSESWEICDHGANQSLVTEGPYAGYSLGRLVNEQPSQLFGPDGDHDQFPLLIKYLDCNQTLSVQVHPDDELAEQLVPGENGKSEVWVIMEARPDSKLYAGLREGVTREKFEQAIENGTVAECLHVVTPQPGEVYYIPAGTVHALGEGLLVAEIQQMSDLTYRIHDWGWVDGNGEARQLHLDEALLAINFEAGPITAITPQTVHQEAGFLMQNLLQSPYFHLKRFRISDSASLAPFEQCQILMVLQGAVELSTAQTKLSLQRGSTVLVPATCPAITLDVTSQEPADLLLVSVPN